MIHIDNATWESVLNGDLSFSALFRVLPQEGNLAWEYNPFRNYRINETCYYYNDSLYSPSELITELDITEELLTSLGVSLTDLEIDSLDSITDSLALELIEAISAANGNSWSGIVPDDLDDPTLLEAGELTDFLTDELSFDLNHPVDVLAQYSYDGSVNLILNDGTNLPRLINSRFSPIGRNQYEIVDRKGDNDTNIYDQGDLFDVDTSLYKRTTTIAKLSFTGVRYSGNLPIGNYHFYFKYEDADGNLTDFIAESGLVSIFIGNEPYNIHSGFRNENSNKGCAFLLSNLDPAYQYISVYYTKDTSDIYLNYTTSAYKINLRYLINNANICNVYITGYEDITEVTLDDINPYYLIVLDAFTLDQCLNMLFLANVHKVDIPYTELQDISLRIYPKIYTESYNLSDKLTENYEYSDLSETYYSPNFIYDKVGYWPNEIYRFGIVYILSDNTLSPVFNIRGGVLNEDTEFTKFAFYNDAEQESRSYISYDESTYLIQASGESISGSDISLENSKGVVLLNISDNANIVGITFNVGSGTNDFSTDTSSYEEDETLCIVSMLQSLKIKGFFFVRLKRIPTTLCQAFTIGIDKESHVPAIPVTSDGETNYLVEQFLDEDLVITHDLTTYSLIGSDVDFAAICPEYDVDNAYYNTLFSGDSYVLTKINEANLVVDPVNERHFYMLTSDTSISSVTTTTRVIGVEDNVKLVGLGDYLFSARAGEAEEAYRYEYILYENVTTEATNLVRGSYGPYLGIEGAVVLPNSIIDIRIPGYSSANMSDYFLIRYLDKASYFAVSDRYSLLELSDAYSENGEITYTCFRGDCYICLFTHRVNRNFSDPSAPTNDKIVDKDCWADHYEVEDDVVKTENFDEINLGDVNAKKLGLWVTIQVRATRNLCVRAIDESIPDEAALYGQARGFYPYLPMRTDGSYKIPEALCYNSGFSSGLSQRYNFEIPDVPYIKNEYANRILYSDIHVNDAFTNGFRTFQGTHFRDYPKTYGSITRIIELRGMLVCVFEHGVALIAVNERAVAGEGSGGTVYINTSNVLPENPKVLSDCFGSLWRESVIKTPYGIYGVDTVGKKIWRTNGLDFECISDFKILEFLNDNISLTERELDPIIGVRNVKTHYNKYKHDVMFTFYDNLYGFEEKVWNICYNELKLLWITFYSWVPSYSENIYNQYFSFDRNTSKWIAKLGVSNTGNDFSDGVTLSLNIIYEDSEFKAELSLSNRTLPSGDDIEYTIVYSLERDNYGNYKLFEIQEENGIYYLVFTGNYDDITSEFYERDSDGNVVKDDRGRRVWLDTESLKNPDKIVLLLNIKANIVVSYSGESSLAEAYATGYTDRTFTDEGYYESVIAVIPDYNMLFLTTDFWKHGQAGIIDIADKIYPTYWYGKLHPFEFEFVVADNPQCHKIFDNLLIISNNAEPESFHYEVIGDCYDFARDKKNMYIRLEATKELYQYNGCDITYDHDYSDLESVHRPLVNSKKEAIDGWYDKSALLPLYYSRLDTINEIEDAYHLKDDISTKDFSALAGGEIVHYDTLDEYRIWNHTKAVDMLNEGRIRGNMQYKEDLWYVLINPINVVYKNEPAWDSEDLFGRTDLSADKIPIELGLSPIPDDVLESGDITYDPDDSINNDIPENSMDRAIVSWGWTESQIKEVKPKDKWMKIRIRYTGNKLAIITAIRTLYSISYA